MIFDAPARTRLWFAAVLGAVLGVGCCPTPPREPRVDLEETPEEKATGLDACARAAARLAKLSCPEASPHFAEKCRYLLSKNQPICPTRIARMTACEDIEGICR